MARRYRAAAQRKGSEQSSEFFKEYAEHGSSEMLTFANFHVRVLIG